MHVKKDQNVLIIAGKDKGTTAKVLRAFPKEGKILVEGVNMKKAKARGKKMGEKAELVDRAFPIDASNVRLAK